MPDTMTSEIDIDRVRADCPACEERIHFNNAGAALSPQPVLEAVIDYLRLEQRAGGYEAARQCAADLAAFYPALASLLHCREDEIAFMENATRAWDMALHAIDWRAGDEIITASNEYASNYLALLHLARRRGVVLRVTPVDDCGCIDLVALEASINDRTRALALTHIASQRGDIQPAASAGQLARKHGLLYLLDACQSAGQVELDVENLGCDFLAGTGRKYLRGPRGTGFLYVRKSRLDDLDPVFIDLHAARWVAPERYEWAPGAARFETFERSLAGQLGLARAVSYADALGLAPAQRRIQALATRLREALSALPGITVLERSAHCSGIVTFTSARETAPALQQRLQAAGINTSIVRQANAWLDLGAEGRGDVNRASLHYYNTETEIDRFVAALLAG